MESAVRLRPLMIHNRFSSSTQRGRKGKKKKMLQRQLWQD